MSGQVEYHGEGKVDSPLLLDGEVADQIAQAGGVDCSGLLDQPGVDAPSNSMAGRNAAARAERDVGATNTMDNAIKASDWTTIP